MSGVPFSFFCSLVREISKINPKAPGSSCKASAINTYPACHVFQNWTRELNRTFSPIPARTTAICFRFLFPEEDTRRKYDIQETRMAFLLADCLGIDGKAFERWSLEESSGCLGHELRVVMERTCSSVDGFISPFTIAEVDELLDELAAKSGYSDASIRSKYRKEQSRTRADILRQLYRSLSPEDAAVLTQIILKDMRPLLYPLTEFHYSVALTRFNSAAVKMLTKEHAMNVWDPSGAMLQFYRINASIDAASAIAEVPSSSRPQLVPKIGLPVAMPKSEKGQSCLQALDFFSKTDIVWAETKYDGERAQIHVEISGDNSSRITIFSKSKRDSTLDRYTVHGLIRSALGLVSGSAHFPSGSGSMKIKHHVILDAEMVAFRGEYIEEFWRIRRLIEDTAHGVRGARKRKRSSLVFDDGDGHESMKSEANEGMSLGLVFFDIMFLDMKSLLSHPYSRRRQILESYPGEPHQTLRNIFAKHIACHQEGLVLKADSSYYNDHRKPWVKLKKDYIPGYGDSIDLVIIGAGWEKVRGRSLRVPPSTFTTFFIGVLIQGSGIQTKALRPEFHVYFTVSYGLSRDQLEELNFFIKSSDPIPFGSLDSSTLPFAFNMLPSLNSLPHVILQTPLLVELFGAGFTKAPESMHYELRFPRMIKIYRPSERGWTEAVDSFQLHKIARASIGRDRSNKDIDDWCNSLWGKPVSPRVGSSLKRKAMTELWDENLAKYEKGRRNGTILRTSPTTPTKSQGISISPLPLATKTNMPKPEYQCPTLHKTNGAHDDLELLSASLPQISAPSIGPITPPSSGLNRRSNVDVVPPEEFKNCLAWFAQTACENRKPCAVWKAWKKQIPRERRLHSLDSLLVGCGWNQGLPARCDVEKGLIFMDECGEHSQEWKRTITTKLESLRTSHEAAAGIWVYGCTGTVNKC